MDDRGAVGASSSSLITDFSRKLVWSDFSTALMAKPKDYSGVWATMSFHLIVNISTLWLPLIAVDFCYCPL